MSVDLRGAVCKSCQRDEQRCAYLWGACCADCTHWRYYDEAGNPIVYDTHGTEAGFQRHRYHNQSPCIPCRVAHGTYNREQCEKRARRLTDLDRMVSA